MHTQATGTSSDTVEDLRRAEGEGIASSQALAEDAIIWASQHGLVMPPLSLPILERVCCFSVSKLITI